MTTPNPQRPRRAVGGLGFSNPVQQPPGFTQQMLESVVPSQHGGVTINPQIFEGAPPWAAALITMVENLKFDLEVLTFALRKRGILTEPEELEARMKVSQAMDSAYRSAVSDLEREVLAKLTNEQPPAPPEDPRRSPS